MIPIKNYDEYMKEKKEYINKNPLMPKWPFRCLISGASASGKTNILLNMIMDYIHWDKLYVCSKMVNTEDKYIELQDWIKHIEQNLRQQIKCDELNIGYFYDNFNDLPNVDSDKYNPECQNLVILDDMITTKNQSTIIEMAIRGRKKNISFIYISQSFHDIPKIIRKNCTDFIFCSFSSKREIQEITKSVATRISYDEFIKIYNHCTEQEYGFLYIATREKLLCRWIRCGFDTVMAYNPK